MATGEIDVEDIPTDLDQEQETEEQSAGGRFKLGGKKVKVLALLGVIMVVYAIVGYFFIPKPVGTANGSDDPTEGVGGAVGALDIKKVEVVLGEGTYNTTNETAGDGSSIHIKFKLYVTLASGQAEEFEDMANDTHKNRVKEAVIEVCRGLSREDLRDPKLSVMKRQIRDKVNRLLGSTAIIDVVISEYSAMEQ